VAVGEVTKVFFNLESSHKGALLCVTKQPRVQKPEDIEYEPAVVYPHALPLFLEINPRKLEQ